MHPDIEATEVVLYAAQDIGASSNALDTVISNLEAQATAGGIWVGNTGDLTIGGSTSSLNGLSAAGDIVVTTSGTMDVDENVIAGGSVTLAAAAITTSTGNTISAGTGVSLAASRDLTTGTDSVVTATTGSITASAGRDMLLDDRSALTAGTHVTLLAGANLTAGTDSVMTATGGTETF